MSINDGHVSLYVKETDLLVYACHLAAVEYLRDRGLPTVWWAEVMGGEWFVLRVKQIVAEQPVEHFSSRSKHKVIQRFTQDYDASVDKNSHRPIDNRRPATYSVGWDETLTSDGRAG